MRQQAHHFHYVHLSLDWSALGWTDAPHSVAGFSPSQFGRALANQPDLATPPSLSALYRRAVPRGAGAGGGQRRHPNRTSPPTTAPQGAATEASAAAASRAGLSQARRGSMYPS